MPNTTRAGQRSAKLRFAALYAISLLLLFVLMTAFWKRLAPAGDDEAQKQAPEREMYFMQMDTLLHQRMESLDAVYATAVEARQRGEEPPATLPVVRRSFSDLLDSLEKQASYLGDGPKKDMMQLVSAKFRKAFTDRERAISGVFQLPKLQPVNVTTTETSNTGSTEVENLRQQLQERDNRIATLVSASQSGGGGEAVQQLAEKDKTIAALQAQLKQKDAALQNAGQGRPVVSGGGEWQQKYATLKTSFDRISASEKNLKAAYQSLADDNRRLLSQVQSLRKQ